MSKKEMSASEAIFGFCAWLTCRKEVVRIGASELCPPVVNLINQFMIANKLGQPSQDYPDNVVMPDGGGDE